MPDWNRGFMFGDVKTNKTKQAPQCWLLRRERRGWSRGNGRRGFVWRIWFGGGREGVEQSEPIKRREEGVFNEAHQHEGHEVSGRTFEFPAGAQPQGVSQRKQIGVGKQVRVLTHGRSALGAEVHEQIVRLKAAMTQRHGGFGIHFHGDLVVPGVRLRRPAEEPLVEDPGKTECKREGGEPAGLSLPVGSVTAQLSDDNHPCSHEHRGGSANLRVPQD